MKTIKAPVLVVGGGLVGLNMASSHATECCADRNGLRSRQSRAVVMWRLAINRRWMRARRALGAMKDGDFGGVGALEAVMTE